MPGLRDADAARLAAELLLAALVGGHGGTAELVAGVVAVGDAIALVRLVDALVLAVAFELGGGAGDGRAVLLVRVVKAV